MNQHPEEIRLNDIEENSSDEYIASLPLPAEPLPKVIDPDNPPWNLTDGIGTWLSSIIVLFIFPTIALIPYAIILQSKGIKPEPQFLSTDPTGVLLVVLSTIPIHIITALIVWSVVTNWHKRFLAKLFVIERQSWKEKRPFVRWLGLEWKSWFEVVSVIGFTLALFFIAGLLAYFIGGEETEIDRMLKVSPNVRYAFAFIAAFTAPIAEELVYRGVLYPASRKMPGMTLAFIGTILLAATPLVWLAGSNKSNALKLLFAAVICLAVAIIIAYTSLKEHRNVIAVIEVSLLFTLIHVPQYIANPGVIAAILLLSISITTVRAVTGRLLPCIILHFIFNGVQAVQIVLQPVNKSLPESTPTQGFIILKTILFHIFF